jgi:hypothetical protein
MRVPALRVSSTSFGHEKMVQRVVMFGWLLSLVGCSTQQDGRSIENSIRPLTAEETQFISRVRDREIADLRAHYSLSVGNDDVELLQQTVRDGSFSKQRDMQVLGIAWGDVICRESGAQWVTAEWKGTRMLALNVPKTTILLFPIGMLEKRRDRNEAVEFRLFLKNTADAITQMKSDPEYKR